MGSIQFDWDVSKAAANLKKHKVSFEEALKSILGKKDKNNMFGDNNDM
jgi:uncharacterized DUF497 family protein